MRRTTKLLFLVVSASALVAAGCAQEGPGDASMEPPVGTTAPPEAGFTGTLQASDQESDGTRLVVDSASIDGGPGFLVVHRDDENAPGPVVGQAAIPEGSSSNVEIEFDQPVESGQYWAMLHVDVGDVGTFEFPGADKPVAVAGDIVMTQLTLTVG